MFPSLHVCQRDMHNVCACMHAYRRIYLRVCVFDSESDVIQDALAG